MQRAEGNLITGTYIAICNPNSDNHVAKAEAKGDGYQVSGTKNRNDENTEVRTMSTPQVSSLYSYSLVAF